MSPLDAAVPLKQVDGVTMHVSEHLNLDVSAESRGKLGDGMIPFKNKCTNKAALQYLGSSTNFSTSMTSSLKDFLASRLADSNCSKKSESDRAIRIP